MNPADRAKEYAQLYVKLTEELMKAGVSENTAREEAHAAASAWLISETSFAETDPERAETCPMCGR